MIKSQFFLSHLLQFRQRRETELQERGFDWLDRRSGLSFVQADSQLSPTATQFSAIGAKALGVEGGAPRPTEERESCIDR